MVLHKCEIAVSFISYTYAYVNSSPKSNNSLENSNNLLECGIIISHIFIILT